MNAILWRRARQITQGVSLVAFFLLAFVTYRESASPIPPDVYFRLDPFAAFTAMLASRTVITTMLLATGTLVLSLILGRTWCGWVCPLGTLLDWVSPRAADSPRKIEPRPAWRAIKYLLLLTALFAALLGNLTLLIFDPLTIVNRAFSGAFLPALNVILVAAESALYPLAPFQPLFDLVEQNWRGTVLPAQQTFYQVGWALALVLIGLLALNWVVPRFWCRYICPLGGVVALCGSVSWLRPRAVSDCDHCAACMRVCPTGAIAVNRNGFSVNPAECVVCFDCVAECPQSVIELKVQPPQVARPAPSFDISRRDWIKSAAFAVGGIALFRSAYTARRDDAFLVRPPGARENGFLSKCIRCAECVKVCPTGGLQPSVLESGWEGFWSPLLVPRLGYCDYSCNACGQVCPTGAIPPLSVELKRAEVIGTAYIDQNRCIPWAMYRRCVVCEEMCPVPEKAIRLEEVDVMTPEGNQVHLQRPRVVHDLCIGCGICEYQCPLVGPAAIRVYVPTRLPQSG